MHGAPERQRRADRVFDGAPIEHRQCAGKPQADRTDLSVGGSAKRGAAAAENLAGRE